MNTSVHLNMAKVHIINMFISMKILYKLITWLLYCVSTFVQDDETVLKIYGFIIEDLVSVKLPLAMQYFFLFDFLFYAYLKFLRRCYILVCYFRTRLVQPNLILYATTQKQMLLCGTKKEDVFFAK